MAELTRDHLQGMTVAVTGATGNLGTALLRRLTAPGSGVAEVRGLARRDPPETEPYAGVRWHLADLGDEGSEPALEEFLSGADAVVHLAWALQQPRRPEAMHRANVGGTRRVARAAVAAGVPHLVHASSLAVYTAGTLGHPVSEDWPTTGIPTSQYSQDKAEAERVVQRIAGRHPGTTVSVVRPTLVLQPDAASELGRYFLGPLLYPLLRAAPSAVTRRLPVPLPRLSVAFVHADDVADALARILDRRAPGPFNLAAEPVMDAGAVARTMGGFRVPVPRLALRTALEAAYTARLVPTDPGWLDVATLSPALDSTRARTVLDWHPAQPGDEVFARFVDALDHGEGGTGPLLEPAAEDSAGDAEEPAHR